MKNIITILTFLLCSAICFGQSIPVTDKFPVKQGLGNSDSTVVITNAIRPRAGLINAVYTDTTSANNGRIYQYAGAQIWTTDNKLWVRNNTNTRWINIVSDGGGDIAVETMADLRDIEGGMGSPISKIIGTDNSTVILLGQYAAGDNGTKQYYWSPSSTATDDTLTVVKPTATSGAGRWLIVTNARISAAQAGIKTDGTDQSTAIRAAFANPYIKELIFETGATTYNGRIDVPAGKILTFRNDSYLKGNGGNNDTLSGGLIQADYNKKIFDTTLTVVNLMNSDKISGVWFWMLSDNSANNYTALTKAIGSITTGTVYIPGATSSYRLYRPIVINKAVNLTGDLGGTTLFFINSAGIIINTINTTTGILLKNIKFQGNQSSDTTHDGIWSDRRMDIDRCVINEFGGDGIEINTTTSGNANISTITGGEAFFNKGHGLYIVGNDANACKINGFSSVQNGKCGIYDISFLGNFYNSIHLATNGQMTGQKGWVVHNSVYYTAYRQNINVEPGVTVGWANYWMTSVGSSIYATAWNAGTNYEPTGAFVGDNPNQKTSIWGYVESDQGKIYLSKRSNWLGGLVEDDMINGAWLKSEDKQFYSNNGFFMYDTTSTVSVFDRKFSLIPRGFQIREESTGGTIDMRVYDSDGFFRMLANADISGTSLESFALTYKALSTAAALYGRSSDILGGNFLFSQRGFFFRDLANPTTTMRMFAGSTTTPAPGDYGAGDFIWNMGTSDNSLLGWKYYSGQWNPISIPDSTISTFRSIPYTAFYNPVNPTLKEANDYVVTTYGNDTLGFFPGYPQYMIPNEVRQIETATNVTLYKAFPTINRNPITGTMIIMYMTGDGHANLNTASYKRSVDNAKTWSQPVDLEIRQNGSNWYNGATISRKSDGRWFTLYENGAGNTLGLNPRISNIKVSTNDGVTWVSGGTLDGTSIFGYRMTTQTYNILQPSFDTATFLIPVYGLDAVGTNFEAGVIKSNTSISSWTYYPLPQDSSVDKFNESAFYEIEDSIFNLARSEKITAPFYYRTPWNNSTNTWGTPEVITFNGSPQPFKAMPSPTVLPDGRIMLVIRTNEAVVKGAIWISEDNGRSYTYKGPLYSGNNPFMYASGLVIDNTVYYVYATETPASPIKCWINLATFSANPSFLFYKDINTASVINAQNQPHGLGENWKGVTATDSAVSTPVKPLYLYTDTVGTKTGVLVGADIAVINPNNSLVIGGNHTGHHSFSYSPGINKGAVSWEPTVGAIDSSIRIAGYVGVGIKARDGNYYFATADTTGNFHFTVVNPFTKDTTRIAAGTSIDYFGSGVYEDSVYFLPSNSTTMKIINIRDFSVTNYTLPSSGWYGFNIVGGKGRSIKRGSGNEILVFDCKTRTHTLVTTPVTGSWATGPYDGRYQWYLPYSSSFFLKQDVTTEEVVTYGQYIRPLAGAAFRTQGIFTGTELWMADILGNTIAYLNPVTQEKGILTLPSSGTYPGIMWDGVSVYAIPRTGDSLYKIDPKSKRIVGIKLASNSSSAKFYGGFMDNNKVVIYPSKGGIVNIFEPVELAPDPSQVLWNNIVANYLATTFVALPDGPGAFAGQAGMGVRVNAGETALEYVAFTGSGTVTSVAGTTDRITITGTPTVSPVVDIASTYAGQTSITTLGTVTTGTLGTGAVIGGVTMTLGSDAANDMYYRNASGILTRLANGTTGQSLIATTGSAPTWGTPTVASLPLSSITDAVAGNTINNGVHAQSWGWNTLASTIGMTFASTSTAAASNTQELVRFSLSGANSNSTQTTTTAKFFNTHSGTSSTNIAALFQSTGGTTNYAAQFTRGKVSFGVAGTETAVLELNGVTSGTATLTVPSVAGTPTFTFPIVTGTIVQYAEASITSSATPTPTGDARENFLYITALTTNPTFGAPSGTAVNGNKIIIRATASGADRTPSFNAIYEGSTDIALPTNFVNGSETYMCFLYNSSTTKWQLVGLTAGF